MLNRQVKRSHLTHGDRLRLVLLARCSQFWQQALYIVQPDTLLRWHRELFRLFWRYKSRQKNHEPRITQETIDLLKQMAQKNRLWGAERLRGELLELLFLRRMRKSNQHTQLITRSPLFLVGYKTCAILFSRMDKDKEYACN